ncbi:MAG: beta-galactosidase [Treponema sp.]|jgi:beta-galactosidase|nr:beta-galactosidase [Treponema sp.]
MRFPSIVARYPHFLHGGDYNPEQWLKWKDTIWQEDMRLAKLAGINSLSIGIFSWSMLEPQEDEYHFEWLDEMMDMLADNNMIAVLATPTGARPAWMSKKYPEVLRVNAGRQRNIFGGRHNHCLSSPVYREKTTAINIRLVARYKDHPALGVWHISNEYGGDCHCPLCQERFRSYLKGKYKTLDALNQAWWSTFWSHTYSDWDEIESPSPLGDMVFHGLNLDWKRFTTEQFVDFYLHEIKPMKEFSPLVPCTTNLMGIYPGIDYYRLAEVMDVAAWDNYPRWVGNEKDIAVGSKAAFCHDIARGLKGKPFMVIESCPSATNWQAVPKLRRPGAHVLQSMQAVAHGSDTVQYFQFRKSRGSSEKFHGAVVDHEGSEQTRVFKDVAEVGRRLASLDAVIGSDTPSKVAIIYDWNVRWALDDAKGFLQDKTDYETTVIDHYRAFWSMGIPVDVIDSTRSFDKYDLLVSPMLYLLRDGTAERINAFVENGGTYVATYATGYVDSIDLCFLGGFPGPLKETLGIWNEEIDALFPEDENSILWQGKSYRAVGLCELIHAKGAETLGVYGSDFYAGTAALTVNRKGKGRAYYIAARTGPDFLADFYGMVTAAAGVKPLLEAPLPEGVTAQARSNGETEFVFLMNFSGSAKTVDAGSAGILNLAPFDVRIIERKCSKIPR